MMDDTLQQSDGWSDQGGYPVAAGNQPTAPQPAFEGPQFPGRSARAEPVFPPAGSSSIWPDLPPDSAHHAQPQYTQPQPQYTQPQYTQAQYGQPQYTQPQYGQAPGGPVAPGASLPQGYPSPMAYGQFPQVSQGPWAPERRRRFGRLAWAALILGIVGVAGSIIPLLDNLSA